jgi:hypothetical protein
MADEKKPPPQEKLLGEKVVIINLGLAVFEESLKRQGVEVVVVRWRPPRTVPADVASILSDLL